MKEEIYIIGLNFESNGLIQTNEQKVKENNYLSIDDLPNLVEIVNI